MSPSNVIANNIVDSNTDTSISQTSKPKENNVKSFPNNNSGNGHNPNPAPVEAIAIVSNKSKDNSKCNKSKGNEIATKNQTSNSVNVQESKQGKGIKVTRSIENHSDSRKSSVGSMGGSGTMWTKCSRTGSLVDPTPEQIRTEARGLVEVVRELTGLSHTVSQVDMY